MDPPLHRAISCRSTCMASVAFSFDDALHEHAKYQKDTYFVYIVHLYVRTVRSRRLRFTRTSHRVLVHPRLFIAKTVTAIVWTVVGPPCVPCRVHATTTRTSVSTLQWLKLLAYTKIKTTLRQNSAVTLHSFPKLPRCGKPSILSYLTPPPPPPADVAAEKNGIRDKTALASGRCTKRLATSFPVR